MWWRVAGVLVATLCALPTAASAQDTDTIITVTLCQLLADPAAYNHKLIKITGRVSRGFEDFTISDEGCDNQNTLWLEFGGTAGPEVVYCCNMPAEPERPIFVVVEGRQTTIVRDAHFETFQAVTKGRGTATATIMGRYFSGRQQKLAGGTYWMGYGHLGMASLLVIQQVMAVDGR